MSLRHLIALIAGVALIGAAYAHDYKAGELQVGHPWARPTVPGQPSGGAYLSIENKGKTGDKLVSVASPVAKSAEIHTMSMEGNVMKMREVGSIDIKPSEKIAMQPGNGYHIMLIGLVQPLKVGDKVPLTLTFEKAGKLEVSVYVEDKSAGKGDGKDGMEHMQH
ncbi:copper chaperone PCu(A)C [Herbaspirillum sp. RV1423]|uniref:copper chaperone PCu(A)C n=1 Tax=Herbaspirillum sp. RV1423 TaxID=1443993 RepID=UPI0004BC2896|nr:copper chaperone PCu(A)C [Herbaspirillum sp. RV1423]